MGWITEIFHYTTAAVLLYNYKADPTEPKSVKTLGVGVFIIRVITQETIIMTICSVGGFHWPITKDIPIVRMGKNLFVMGFPGLLYALQLPSHCDPSILVLLERIFMKHSHYFDYVDANPHGLNYPTNDSDPDIWKIIRPIAEPIAHNILTIYGHQPGPSRFSVSKKHNSCLIRAVRLSAASKALIHALVSGILTPNKHIIITQNNNIYDSPNNTTTSVYPSISVFTSLVDVLEATFLAYKGLVSNVFNAIPPLMNYPDAGFKVWRLNEKGLVTFVKGLDLAASHEMLMVTDRTGTLDDDTDSDDSDDDDDDEEDSDQEDPKGKGKLM